MDDKERILMAIVTRTIPKLAYRCHSIQDREEIITSNCLNEHLEKGDLVIASSTFAMNDFIVGFVEEFKINRDYVVIREIGSKRLCNYYNEMFYKINKEILGNELLEGVEYKTYQKVLSAFNKYTDYGTRFKSIKFENGKCFVESRIMFSTDTVVEVSFDYNSKTSIKSIGEVLKKQK